MILWRTKEWSRYLYTCKYMYSLFCKNPVFFTEYWVVFDWLDWRVLTHPASHAKQIYVHIHFIFLAQRSLLYAFYLYIYYPFTAIKICTMCCKYKLNIFLQREDFCPFISFNFEICNLLDLGAGENIKLVRFGIESKIGFSISPVSAMLSKRKILIKRKCPNIQRMLRR